MTGLVILFPSLLKLNHSVNVIESDQEFDLNEDREENQEYSLASEENIEDFEDLISDMDDKEKDNPVDDSENVLNSNVGIALIVYEKFLRHFNFSFMSNNNVDTKKPFQDRMLDYLNSSQFNEVYRFHSFIYNRNTIAGLQHQ